MAKETILIVEDDEDILELIQYNLKKEGFNVETAMSGEDAIAAVDNSPYDLIVLDLMLPGVDGLDVCRHVRSKPESSNTAIIMLTAKTDEIDIVTGLELGADDYMTKPFSPRVLIARVRSILRRRTKPTPPDNEVIIIHDISIDPDRFEVNIKGKKIDLTATEFKLLHLIALKPGRVFTRDQIIEAIHGAGYPVTDRSVDVQVVGLRKKLGAVGKKIETVHGIGYRMKEES